jgi:hypothetical protein
MTNPDQPVLARQLTAFFMSVATVLEGMIRAGNMDRPAILAFIRETSAGLSVEKSGELLPTLLHYWEQVIERGPGKVPPPSVH